MVLIMGLSVNIVVIIMMLNFSYECILIKNYLDFKLKCG